MLKRFIALIIVLLICPLFMIGMLLIIIIDRQYPLFFQNRVGKNKIQFVIYKFRTMKNGEITRLGRLLRVTGMDELLQFINVIKGEMNFIGPRPLTENDIDRLEWNTDFHNIRWSILPGITGMSQLLSPICHKKMTWFFDKYYISNKTIRLDLKLLFISLFILVLGKKRTKNIFL